MEMNGNEKFWVGHKDAWLPEDHVVSHVAGLGRKWIEDTKGLCLDPNYSEFSIRIYDSRSRTLSFILGTVAIIPKSLLKRIHTLIGAYLKKEEEDGS